MTTKFKVKKGTSLIVVFIICTVIGILLSTTFFVVSNYGVTVIARKVNLQNTVCPTCEIEEDTPETSGEETSGETTNPEETPSEEITPETTEEGSVE